jgi:DNA mismatch repair protein MutS
VSKETPLVKQYQGIKSQYPDTFLFFRLGDFYELFGDDAIEASRIMEVALTKRQGMPLCGVPYHSATRYIKKILNKSKSVAICEQVEDPALAKGIVKREVVRVITPGTIIEDDLLADDSNNFLVSLSEHKSGYGAVFLDISTGDFMGCFLCDIQKLETEISMLPVREAVIPEGSGGLENFIKTRFQKISVSLKDPWHFNEDKAAESIKEFFGIATLKGWEVDKFPAVISACGGLVHYLKDTQKANRISIKKFRLYSVEENMILDRNTQENLELIVNLQDGKKKNTLYEALDFTDTAMGRRKLQQWILRPLKDISLIRHRLNSVEELTQKPELSEELSALLKHVNDMERIITKTGFGSCNARDLVALKESLRVIPALKDLAGKMETPLMNTLSEELVELDGLADELESALIDPAPLGIKEGNIIKKGYSGELDELINLTTGDKEWVAGLEQKERDRLGIPSLKVGFNKVHGYYIEVTKVHAQKVTDEYTRKQTLVNSERYTTDELKAREDSILGAQERRASLEYGIFSKLRGMVSSSDREIQKNCEVIAALDVLNSFAIAARKNSYSKPHTGNWQDISIEAGRHPVVENHIRMNNFVPNDTALDSGGSQVLIITGPNMSGKSTYLKQVAIITIMAQMGCFVPAENARIGITDRIFTRIGASENLAGGESTFMVEMTEVASILNNATSESLLIMDEVGRGTSTFDGISIAWSVIEEIARLKARTLFATHYFELTELALCMEPVKNYNFAVREWKDKKKVVFMRKLEEGSADKSYGIHCAQLAGVPAHVIERAWEIFGTLEEEHLDDKGLPKAAKKTEEETAQLSFFGDFINNEKYKAKIKDLNLNNMTPLDLMEVIRQWQMEINDEDKTS